MILQALAQLYDDLAARGEIARLGWSPAKVSFALCLDWNGTLAQIIPTRVEKLMGKKTFPVPRDMILPAIGTRSGKSVKSGFLWDNASYLLGIAEEPYIERAAERFSDCRRLHHSLLGSVRHPVAEAILLFLDQWDPKAAKEHLELRSQWNDLIKGGNLVFRVGGVFAQDIPELAQAWDRYYNDLEKEENSQCLISGRREKPETTHPLIKGVDGAQSSGAALVSFNKAAFCSYGKEQNLNAPVGKTAAFAYTSALNHLLADRENVHRIGDTTIVCWADGAEPAYTMFSNYFIFGDRAPEQITTDDLRHIISRLAQGLPCEEIPLDPGRRFYILGLSPNAARLSVRFFYNSTFGELLKNVAAHHQRLEIAGNPFGIMPLWALLKETVNPNSTDASPSPVMAGAVARSIFTGLDYPASLLQNAMLRIRAEREVTYGRAAILKAYYLKKSNKLCPEEVLTVSLNESSTNIPYTLGRLFAVYEALQEAASPGINTTIKDKYFNSASATPAMIFPILDNLAQKHLRKLETGRKIFFDRQIGNLKNKLGETNPVRLSLPEQGSFNLGYYHQKQSH